MWSFTTNETAVPIGFCVIEKISHSEFGLKRYRYYLLTTLIRLIDSPLNIPACPSCLASSCSACMTTLSGHEEQ